MSEPTIQIADYAGGEDNSVVVTATASKLLPFSSILTGTAATVRASAQASFAEGLNYNACLVSLADEGTGTTIGGNATVRAQCGLAALSCDRADLPAFEQYPGSRYGGRERAVLADFCLHHRYPRQCAAGNAVPDQ